MDKGLCLSEEPGSVVSDGDCTLLEIEYRNLDYKNDDDLVLLAPRYWDYSRVVCGVELNGFVSFEVKGEKIRCHKIESLIRKLQFDQANIMMAIHKGQCVGFAVYFIIADVVLYLKSIYVMPEYEGVNLARDMSLALPKKPSKVIFQTSKKLPPMRCLKQTAKHSKLIGETEEYKTWEMDWRGL